MDKKSWKDKNVLITGYEGFVGSNLTKRLIVLGAKIVGLDIKVNRKETAITRDDYNKINVIKGSVTDYNLLKEIISKYEIGVIYHLAAEAIVGKSLKCPLDTFSTNIQGTWSVLEACRDNKIVKAIVVASSDKAYGSHKKLPYTEGSPLIANTTYDVSKSCADLIASAYHHTYGLPVAITRSANIYGSGDFNFSRIIPDTIRCIILGKTLLIRSNGRFIRDYIYVDDVVDGYIILAEKLNKHMLWGEAFNFSNEEPISVIELVKKICQLCHTKLNYRILNQAKHEIKRQYLDASKARMILGWKPKYNLDKGLNKAIEWYGEYFEKK